MNIHPLMIHFPIGLLATYSVLEFIRYKKVLAQPYWFYVKATLVILGAISAQAAVVFGSMIENMFLSIPEKNAIVPVHEIWAMVTTVIFTFLAICYLITWIRSGDGEGSFGSNSVRGKLWNTLSATSKLVAGTTVSLVFAIMGLISITITGALGGAMVHGIGFDPFITFVYHLFL